MAYVEQHQLPLNPYMLWVISVGCWSCLQDFFKTDSGLFTLKRTHPGMYKSLKHQFGEELLAVLTAWGASRNMASLLSSSMGSTPHVIWNCSTQSTAKETRPED